MTIHLYFYSQKEQLTNIFLIFQSLLLYKKIQQSSQIHFLISTKQIIKLIAIIKIYNMQSTLNQSSSFILGQTHSSEHQKAKNRKRLLQQNRLLNVEIKKLEDDMNDVIFTEKKKEEDEKKHEESTPSFQKQKQDLIIQQNYIKKLKSKIQFYKDANVKRNAFFIRKQEDSLLLVKKEYEQLQIQKQTITRLKNDKIKALGKNLPFEEHKTSLETSLAEVKKSNRQKHAQIIRLERDVRKYHNYFQLSNQLERQRITSENLNFQITKAENQSKQINRKVKQTEAKWKPQFDALDSEYFQMKNTLLETEDRLYQIEKEARQWQTRISALRDEQQILDYRQRLSKIHLLEPNKMVPTHKNDKIVRKWEKSPFQKQKNDKRDQENENKGTQQNSLQKNKPATSPIAIGKEYSNQQYLNLSKPIGVEKKVSFSIENKHQQETKKPRSLNKLKKNQKIIKPDNQTTKKDLEEKQKRERRKFQKLHRNEWNHPPVKEGNNESNKDNSSPVKENIKLQTNEGKSSVQVEKSIQNTSSPKKSVGNAKMILKSVGVGETTPKK